MSHFFQPAHLDQKPFGDYEIIAGTLSGGEIAEAHIWRNSSGKWTWNVMISAANDSFVGSGHEESLEDARRVAIDFVDRWKNPAA